MTGLETMLSTVIGSGLGTTLVGAWFKRKFDVQIETQKALLQRSGKIHERQVDTLCAIHAKLDEALFYLQRAAGTGKLEGQASDKELLDRMARALGEASTEFAKTRLLISEGLGQRLDAFFQKMLFAGIDVRLAIDPMVADGEPRAKLWESAKETAYKEIPDLLKAIRNDARAVIHG